MYLIFALIQCEFMKFI